MVVKGESWRNHAQSKAHSSRIHSVQSLDDPPETEAHGVTPLIFTQVPHPQSSAVIPVGFERLWADLGWIDDGLILGRLHHPADGSLIQFSAGLMYPTAKEAIRCEMDRIGEELEAWGSSLVGQGFEEEGRIADQCEGKLYGIFYFPTHYCTTRAQQFKYNTRDGKIFSPIKYF